MDDPGARAATATPTTEATEPPSERPAGGDSSRAPTPPSRRRSRLLPWVGPVGLVAVACALPLVELWRVPGPPMEEGFMLVFPELVLEGWVPNRDFLHLYGPGSLWVLAGAFKLFGTTLEVERIVGLLQLLGVVSGVFALLRPWGRWLAAAGATVTAVVLLPAGGLTALAWIGGLALALWALDRALGAAEAPPETSRRRRGWVAAGLLAGVALLYRPDLALGLGLAVLGLWRAIDPAGRRRFLGALALGLSPYLVHIATAGPGTVFRGLVVEPVFELRGGRSLPFPPSWSSFDGYLQRVAALVEPSWPLPAPPTPAQLVLWVGLLLAANALLLAAGIVAARRGERRLLVLALFSAGLLPQAIQRADSTHLAWVSCVPLGLLPAAVVELTRTWRPRVRSVPRAALAAVVPAVATVALAPTFVWGLYGDYVARSFGQWEREAGTIRRGDRTFHYGRLDAVAAVDALLPDVERIAEPGDSLLVGTGDLRKTPHSEAFLYYLLPELDPATRYIEMDPGIANAPDSGLANELRAADVVILSTIKDDWDEPNDSRVFGANEPNEVIAEDFCLVGSYGEGPAGRGLYELYERCARARG